jgi:demethylmenaquinone methyltransferase/2-methoxy-6-polyprenyl-1,4-benzoquinol methylase
MVSGSREAYEYLPGSVGRFYTPDEMMELMRAAGFTILDAQRFSFGVVVAYIGEKANG